MGLLNSRNFKKAKSMLDKNRHKIGDVVDKATDQLDKVSKGKTSSMSAKVDEAARKYSAGGSTDSGLDVPDTTSADPSAPAGGSHDVSGPDPYLDEDLQRRQAEAAIAATNSAAAAADAFANLMNKAADETESAKKQSDPEV